MTDVKTREQELAEEFKSGLSPDDAVKLAMRVDELEAKLANQTEPTDWQAQREALEADRDAAEKRAEKAEKAATATKAKVADGPKPAKPRKLEPMDDGFDRDELAQLLADADTEGKTVEIAFSDGKREIAGIAPSVVTGDVWRDHTLGKMLRDPVTVRGPAQGQASFAIAGYALLIDGKPVAYTQRSEPINIAPGQEISLSDDIYF